MVNIPYRRVVSSLMYWMVGTRLDITTTIGIITYFFNNPEHGNWQVLNQANLEILTGYSKPCRMLFIESFQGEHLGVAWLL